jgi:SET domain-containing protein
LLNSKIEKRRSRISGSGLFAKEAIKKDEVVWSPTFELIEKIRVDEVPTLAEDRQYDWIKHSYQIGDFLYKDTDDTRFMNHSCKPNVIDSYNVLVAARDIEKDEEVTWDYLPFMNPYLVFECSCGNQNCVGVARKGILVQSKF